MRHIDPILVEAIDLLDDIIVDLDMRARMNGDIENGKAVLDLSNGLLQRYYVLKETYNG